MATGVVFKFLEIGNIAKVHAKGGARTERLSEKSAQVTPKGFFPRSLLKKGRHPELVEGSVWLSFAFAKAELILRRAQDDNH
jgi:hypothetical protein